jgi:hypothetical protein
MEPVQRVRPWRFDAARLLVSATQIPSRRSGQLTQGGLARCIIRALIASVAFHEISQLRLRHRSYCDGLY